MIHKNVWICFKNLTFKSERSKIASPLPCFIKGADIWATCHPQALVPGHLCTCPPGFTSFLDTPEACFLLRRDWFHLHWHICFSCKTQHSSVLWKCRTTGILYLWSTKIKKKMVWQLQIWDLLPQIWMWLFQGYRLVRTQEFWLFFCLFVCFPSSRY